MVFLKDLKEVRNLKRGLTFLNHLLDNCCCSPSDLLKRYPLTSYSVPSILFLFSRPVDFLTQYRDFLNRLHSCLSDARVAVFNSLTLFFLASSLFSSFKAFWRRLVSSLDSLNSSLMIDTSCSCSHTLFSSIIPGIECLLEESRLEGG